MKQAQIILRFLFPPRQDAAEAVHQAMRPLYNPSASFEADFMFDRLGLFASGSNVGCITKLFHQISYLTRIVSFIQRHTSRFLLCSFRTLYRNTLYRCLHHLAVMAICSIDCQADRHTTCLGQQTPFNTFFGYKAKQVRDNIHSFDLVKMFWHFYQNPREGEVYNAGGGRHSNCSMLEAIGMCEEMTGKKMNWSYSETNRTGDHIWWIGDVNKFKNHYPKWDYKYDLNDIFKEICSDLSKRL